MEIIISAKERQAAEANKNASILLEELDHEKEREERRKAAAAKKRDKKKRKKKKRAEQEMEVENDQQDDYMDDDEVEIVKNEKNKVKCLENGIGMNGIQIKDDEKRRMIINGNYSGLFVAVKFGKTVYLFFRNVVGYSCF